MKKINKRKLSEKKESREKPRRNKHKEKYVKSKQAIYAVLLIHDNQSPLERHVRTE